MEYKVKDTVLNFNCSLGTIRALEQLKNKSFMSIVAGSYSQSGVCLATIDDMLDILGLAYAKAQPGLTQQEAIKNFLEFVDRAEMTYNEIFMMYDKLLVSLQYQGKTEEEIEDIILGNLRKVEATRARLIEKSRKKGR